MSTITGKARPQQGLPLLGRSWQCEERLSGNEILGIRFEPDRTS